MITYNNKPIRIISADDNNVVTVMLPNGTIRCIFATRLNATSPFELARALKTARAITKKNESTSREQ